MGGLNKSLDRSSRSLGGFGNNNGGGAAAVVADRDDGRGGGLDDGATWMSVRKRLMADSNEVAMLTTWAVGDGEGGGL